MGDNLFMDLYTKVRIFKCSKSSTFSILSERKIGEDGAENG